MFLLCLSLPITSVAATVGATEGHQTAGQVAKNIHGSFGKIAQLITASAYLLGLALVVGSIMKFKQHKDNPTQVPIGTPIALLIIGASLLFLPSVLGVTGKTIFGSKAETAGPHGITHINKDEAVTQRAL